MKYLINYNKKTIGQIFLSEDKEKDIRTIYNLATSVILGDNPSYDKVVIQARVKILEEDDFFDKIASRRDTKNAKFIPHSQAWQ